MKAAKFFLVSVFALLFFVGSELSAQLVPCDENDPLAHYFEIEIPVGELPTGDPPCANHHIRIWYCCSVDPISGIMSIELRGVQMFDARCWQNYDFNTSTFWNWMEELLFNYLYNESLNCSLSNLPSCDDLGVPAYHVQSYKQVCWTLESVEIEPGMPSMQLVPCDTEYSCRTLYRLCFNFATGKVEKQVVSKNHDDAGASCLTVGSLEIDSELVIDWYDLPPIPCAATCH